MSRGKLLRGARYSRAMLLGRTRIGDRTYAVSPFSLDPLSRHISDRTYEPWMPGLLDDLLCCSDGAVLDVGANIGQTLMALLRVDPDREYWGFEPQVEAAASISRFISGNRLRNHSILPIAMSSKEGLSVLHRNSSVSVSASLVEDFRPPGFHAEAQSVWAIPGDIVVDRLGIRRIALIKVDVEGGELEVLEGLAGTLKKQVPDLLFEVLPNWLISTGEPLPRDVVDLREQRYRSIEGLLKSLGYSIWRIGAKGERLPVDRLSGADSTDESSNVLAIASKDEQDLGAERRAERLMV